MTAYDSDPELIKTALWNLVKDAGVSDNIFVSNRPDSSKLPDFVIVDTNGFVTDKLVDNGSSFGGKCLCLVQLYAKDIDQKGTEDMVKLSEMYAALIDGLPYNSAPYTFRKKNQVGRRDTLGFHATLINLECLIY
jgi:hypothetical protein